MVEQDESLYHLVDALEHARKLFFECRRAWLDFSARAELLIDRHEYDTTHYLEQFEEQLKIPHDGIAQTFQEYSSAVTKYDNDHYETRLTSVNKIFLESEKEAELRAPWEHKLKDSSFSVQAYDLYIEWQIDRTKKLIASDQYRQGTIALIERAIARDPQSSHFWLVLYHYWVQTDTAFENLQDQLRLALDRCPESAELWQCYIRNTARLTSDPRYVFEAYRECSAVSAFRDEGVITSVYLAARDLIHDGSNQHIALLQGWYDDDQTVLEGSFALGKLFIDSMTNTTAARRMWKRMSKHSENSHQSLFWVSYLQWEIQHGNISAARNLLKNACMTSTDNSAALADAALQFEASYGTISEYEKTLAVIRKARTFPVNAIAPPTASHDEHKRKFHEDEIAQSDDTGNKKRKLPEIGRNREQTLIIVENLSLTISDEQLASIFQEFGQVANVLLRRTGADSHLALIEFDEAESARLAVQNGPHVLDGREATVVSASGTMLYATNYPASYQKKDIEALFAQCGNVLDVRLPSLLYNEKRRFAYVQMGTPEEARSALSLNENVEFGTSKLRVALSDPDGKRDRATAAEERREIFIRRVAWSATSSDLRHLFDQFGAIVSLRMPSKYSDKHHDGLCFIDFESSESAKKALSMHGKLLKGMALDVSLSRPSAPAKSDNARSKKKKPNQLVETQERPLGQTNNMSELPDAAFIQAKTLAVLNLPDTVNEAQLRALFEPYGDLRKVELRHEHGGAIIEYRDPMHAGKASLGMSGKQIGGQTVTIGRYEDLMKQQPAGQDVSKMSMVPRKVRLTRPPQQVKAMSHQLPAANSGSTAEGTDSKRKTEGDGT